MKFTQMIYSLRTGRKENDIQNQKKLEEYANRFVGALENGR
jgi:similarity